MSFITAQQASEQTAESRLGDNTMMALAKAIRVAAFEGKNTANFPIQGWDDSRKIDLMNFLQSQGYTAYVDTASGQTAHVDSLASDPQRVMRIVWR